ncbi:MAG: transposase [Chloroflexi bacterium]|nr:transposase [Chloroflexota bacterium]
MFAMIARRRRSFTPEFKAQTAELVRTSGKSVAGVTRDLDLTEIAVRRWVAQAEIDAGRRDGLTTSEREELSRLRRENRVLRDEREICERPQPFAATWIEGLQLSPDTALDEGLAGHRAGLGSDKSASRTYYLDARRSATTPSHGSGTRDDHVMSATCDDRAPPGRAPT